MTMALLAGGPEHFAYVVALTLLLAPLGCAQHSLRSVARAFALVVAGFAVTGLLAAAQILPTIELMGYAVRASDSFDADYVARFPVTAQGLWNSVVLGAEGVGRLSLLVVPLALCAFLGRGTRWMAARFVVLAIVVLDFLRGTSGWVFPMYHEWVPFARAFRTHLRAEFVWAFLASIVAGLGMHGIATRLAGRRIAAVAIPALLVAALFADLARNGIVGKAFLPLYDTSTLDGTAELPAMLEALEGHERVFVNYGAPARGLHHKFGMLHGVRSIAEYDALVPARYATYFGVPSGTPWMGRLQFADRTKKVGAASLTIPGVSLSALDLASASHYLVGTPSQIPWMSRSIGKVVAREGPYALLERENARPRAYVVHRAIGVEKEEQALWWLRQPKFDPAEFAVVHGAAPSLEPPVDGARRFARVVRETPNIVEVEAECGSRCLLVLTDLHFPGWSVAVDGAAAEILQANYLFRGVVLEAGTHRLKFSYLPRPLVLGAAISLLTLLAALTIVWRERRRAQEPRAYSTR
jgi:hypothetical protein